MHSCLFIAKKQGPGCIYLFSSCSNTEIAPEIVLLCLMKHIQYFKVAILMVFCRVRNILSWVPPTATVHALFERA